MRPGRNTHAPNRHLERPLARIVERAQFPQLPHWDVRVIKSAGMLDGASPLDARPKLGRSHAVALGPQLLVSYRRYLDVQIDAIEERPANLAEIPLDDAARALAFPRGISKKSTRAPVQFRTDSSLKFAGLGWQAHTVRGFVSILGSKGGEKIESSKNVVGERSYRIAK